MARTAPWKDFNGNPIHEFDVIEHPSGERGTVIFWAAQTGASNQWRVDYGDGIPSRLSLQIGEKGRAVVAGGARPLQESQADLQPYQQRFIDSVLQGERWSLMERTRDPGRRREVPH